MTYEERMRLGGSSTVQQPAQQQAQASPAVYHPQQEGAAAVQNLPGNGQTPAYQQLSQPGVIGGADAQINNAYQAITGTAPYKYNLDQDALYQMYRDRYTQNAKRSMQDTMGQAASLTGGYGNTYSQWVGQQAYDETMRGLTDLIPQLEDRAWNRQQQTYSQLSNSILTSGYAPTEAELQAAGMTQEQADALRQAWIASNPGAAWMQGAMTADQYYALTGKTPPGAPGTGSGGGGGGWGSGSGTGSGDGEKATGQRTDKDANNWSTASQYLAMFQPGTDEYQQALQQVGVVLNAAMPHSDQYPRDNRR